MFELYEEVRIKKTAMVGIVIDSYKANGETIYLIEGNEKGKFQTERSPEAYPIIDCKENEIEAILSAM